jgi:hypothetical protein
MFPFDAEAFEAQYQHLLGRCHSLPYQTPCGLSYDEDAAARLVEDMERALDVLEAAGTPSPPGGSRLVVPRVMSGADSCEWRPCAGPDQWKAEFVQAVKDCVATHKALHSRCCALAREYHQAMREADRLFADGKDGGGLLVAFEKAMESEIGRLRTKALAAQERFYCFKHQIDRFGSAAAEEVPSGTAEAARETGGGQTQVAITRDGKPPPPTSPNLFVRLPGDRYLIAFDNKQATVPALAGLRVFEYLLKQPGKPAHVLVINRAITEVDLTAATVADALAGSEGEKGLDGFTADALRQPEPCSDEDLARAEETVKDLEERAGEARMRGETGFDEANRLEGAAERARQWIQENRTLAERKRRGRPDPASAAEVVRIKLTNNCRNALKDLRTKYALPELGAHLEGQIDRGTEWRYRPVAGIDWGFKPRPSLNAV